GLGAARGRPRRERRRGLAGRRPARAAAPLVPGHRRLPGRGRPTHGHARHRAADGRGDPDQRPAATAVPVPHRGRPVPRAPSHARRHLPGRRAVPRRLRHRRRPGGDGRRHRRRDDRGAGRAPPPARGRGGPVGRKILFVTTDQQRYDTLGCNGAVVGRTPVLDRLAAEGVRYTRAVPQSVVCMPSRATMLTGQHPETHGVWMNGVALPVDAPSVAAVLHRAGYRTALIGKPHFEPFLDPFGRFVENGLAGTGQPTATSPWADGTTGPHRGFEHLEFATHTPMGPLHYARWLREHHPEAVGGFYAVLDAELEVNAEGGGATGAPQVKDNPIPREWYHTDWVADRTIAWLDGLGDDEDWFCWMSFPDPHHPWDPPASEMRRVDWRDVPLPAGWIDDRDERERVLDGKPRHWRLWYEGRLVANYEAPARWVPATLTADQVREVNARNAVEVELIDEAVGRVLAAIEARGWGDDVDVIFTTDHGELQGDFGLLFKGPYHVDALMRLPLIW